MKITSVLVIGAAIALSACTPASQDNVANSDDSNFTMSGDEGNDVVTMNEDVTTNDDVPANAI